VVSFFEKFGFVENGFLSFFMNKLLDIKSFIYQYVQYFTNKLLITDFVNKKDTNNGHFYVENRCKTFCKF
jgi:hypothetical protein